MLCGFESRVYGVALTPAAQVGYRIAGDERPALALSFAHSPPLASGFTSRIADTATMVVRRDVRETRVATYVDTMCG